MSEIKEYEISSMSEILKLLEEEINVDDNTLFRGHNLLSWKLEPKIARPDFNYRTNTTNEQTLLETFKRHAKKHLSKEPEDDWDYLSLAQHHGMATRLLDWTKNPLTALWFCVYKPTIEEYGAVWVLQVEDGNFIDASVIAESRKPNPYLKTAAVFEKILYDSPLGNWGKVFVFQPHYLNQRIINQHAWFTVHSFKDDNKTHRELTTESDFSNKLTKIKIPKAAFSEIRSTLDTLGINKMSLFPDLDGVANYAEWLHTTLPDEPSEII